MCGRYVFTPGFDFFDRFMLDPDYERGNLQENYNVSPGQTMPVIIREPDAKTNMLEFMRWGFIPTWAKDLKTVKPQINARAETITAKPFFRSSFLHHRCLIPANGFYEWQKDGKKIPYYYRLNDLPLFAFAGLCDHQTYTIITTQANDLINQVHHRMPVILKPEDESTWLTETTDPTTLLSLLHPYPSKVMSSAQIYPH